MRKSAEVLFQTRRSQLQSREKLDERAASARRGVKKAFMKNYMHNMGKIKAHDIRMRWFYEKNSNLNQENFDAILDHAKCGGFLMVGGGPHPVDQ